jgi:hypothetical protein
MQLLASGASAGGHSAQLPTSREEVPKGAQTLPRPSPDCVQKHVPSGQGGLHIGWQNGGVPDAPSMHSWSSGQGGLHIGTPPEHIPSTHSCPSSQRLEQLPQWCSFCCRFTHLPLQQVWFERHRLRQLPQWRSLVLRFTHLSPQRVCPSEHRSFAQATPERRPRRHLRGGHPST